MLAFATCGIGFSADGLRAFPRRNLLSGCQISKCTQNFAGVHGRPENQCFVLGFERFGDVSGVAFLARMRAVGLASSWASRVVPEAFWSAGR